MAFTFLHEGITDRRFIEGVIAPIIDCEKEDVSYVEYNGMPLVKRVNEIQTARIRGHKIFYLLDGDGCSCVCKKRQETVRQLKNKIDDGIIIVCYHIESWYLAGLPISACKKLKLPHYESTIDIKKDDFERLAYKAGNSVLNLEIEIIKNYSIETAMMKNPTFKYFINKLKQ